MIQQWQSMIALLRVAEHFWEALRLALHFQDNRMLNTSLATNENQPAPVNISSVSAVQVEPSIGAPGGAQYRRNRWSPVSALQVEPSTRHDRPITARSLFMLHRKPIAPDVAFLTTELCRTTLSLIILLEGGET